MIDKYFEGGDTGIAVEQACQILNEHQKHWFLRSVNAQKSVGLVSPKGILRTGTPIYMDQESLNEMMLWYANRHKRIITGNEFPSYAIAESIKANKNSNQYYLAKLCRQSKKIFNPEFYYWSDFCFPMKNHDEITVSNAMAWSSLYCGLKINPTRTVSIPGGSSTTFLSALRTPWEFRYKPFLDKEEQAKQWLNNISDFERDHQIIRSKRGGGFTRNSKTAKRKVPTEYHINKESYIKHFSRMNNSFVVPDLLAPYGWEEVVFRYLSEDVFDGNKAYRYNEEYINMLPETYRAYAKRIPYLGGKIRFMGDRISNGKLVIEKEKFLGLWRSL